LEEYVMDDFRTRVSAFLVDGADYWRDRDNRTGLFAVLEGSRHYEFSLHHNRTGTRVVIAGGDTMSREFSVEFVLRPGPLKPSIARSDIIGAPGDEDVVIAQFTGDYDHMTRNSAVLLYNLAAAATTSV
jgi:hypothetical protein